MSETTCPHSLLCQECHELLEMDAEDRDALRARLAQAEQERDRWKARAEADAAYGADRANKLDDLRYECSSLRMEHKKLEAERAQAEAERDDWQRRAIDEQAAAELTRQELEQAVAEGAAMAEALKAAHHELTCLHGLAASDGLRFYSDALSDGCDADGAWDCFVAETFTIDALAVLKQIETAQSGALLAAEHIKQDALDVARLAVLTTALEHVRDYAATPKATEEGLNPVWADGYRQAWLSVYNIVCGQIALATQARAGGLEGAEACHTDRSCCCCYHRSHHQHQELTIQAERREKALITLLRTVHTHTPHSENDLWDEVHEVIDRKHPAPEAPLPTDCAAP